MEEKIQTKTNSQEHTEPYLKEIFDLYCIWKQIPYFMKYPPKNKKGEELTVEDNARAFGLEDEMLLDMLTLKTQRDFSERFDIDPTTCVRWNKEIEKRDILVDIRVWASRLTKNVVAAMYKHAIAVPDARLHKLWFQSIHGWQEKQTVEHNYQGVKSITYEIIDGTSPETENQQEAVSSNALPDGQRN